jgi:hypothetical protein
MRQQTNGEGYITRSFMRRTGLVAIMTDRRGACKVFVGTRGKEPLERPRYRRVDDTDNFKMDIQEVGRGMDGTDLTKVGTGGRCLCIQ